MGRVGRGLPLRFATRRVSADREGLPGGAARRCGMECAFSLHSVACSPELSVHRPSSLWESNPLTSQEWMELRDRLSDGCVSCWARNCRGAGPAPTAAMATTRQAGLTALGAPSSLRLGASSARAPFSRRAGLDHCTRTSPAL